MAGKWTLPGSVFSPEGECGQQSLWAGAQGLEWECGQSLWAGAQVLECGPGQVRTWIDSSQLWALAAETLCTEASVSLSGQ